MRGATANDDNDGVQVDNFNPRAPCGARRRQNQPMRLQRYFNPRAPCGARPTRTTKRSRAPIFQPTRPLRGATPPSPAIRRATQHFNPRAPCGARPWSMGHCFSHLTFQPTRPLRGATFEDTDATEKIIISTHAPLAGRDQARGGWRGYIPISTHAPLAGRDESNGNRRPHLYDFNPRAPCGARQQKCTNHYAHFCDNRQISDAFAQNAACQGILLLFDAGKPCGFWVRTAQVISAHLCFAL